MRAGERARAAAAGALLLALSAPLAWAEAVVPLPSWARSGAVPSEGLAVLATPDERGARRGMLLPGTRVPLRARVAGAGCGDRRFVQIGDEAFVCGAALTLSEQPPWAPPLSPSGLPGEYLRVVREGARGFARLSDVATDDYATAFGQGFSVAVATRTQHSEQRFVRTRSGLYVRERDLAPVQPSAFRGVELGAGGPALERLAFVVGQDAVVRAEGDGRTLRTLARLAAVTLSGELRGKRLVLADGGLVEERALRRPVLRPPPTELAPDEPFLDVDLERQTLVAYRGATPVFATLISSGKPRPGTATPRGAFRIWVKLQSSDMRDHEKPQFEQSYALEEVPWVQYFSAGYGLHAVFWHDRFGERQSRGCINLSPADARYLFDFTAPALPEGFHAIRPTARDRGTLVVVR